MVAELACFRCGEVGFAGGVTGRREVAPGAGRRYWVQEGGIRCRECYWVQGGATECGGRLMYDLSYAKVFLGVTWVSVRSGELVLFPTSNILFPTSHGSRSGARSVSSGEPN